MHLKIMKAGFMILVPGLLLTFALGLTAGKKGVELVTFPFELLKDMTTGLFTLLGPDTNQNLLKEAFFSADTFVEYIPSIGAACLVFGSLLILGGYLRK